MKYIDTHCHLNLDDYDSDRKEVIDRARKSEVGMIVVGTNLETSKKAVKIAEENDDIWAIIGLHPTEIICEIADGLFNSDAYMELAVHNKVVGIGECGFDYFRNKASAESQREIFEKQISIANEVSKPLMLHMRCSMDRKQNAYEDTLEVLKKHVKVPGNAHFFAGNWEEGREFLNMDFRLSFNGVITFTHDYDEVVRNTPLNMILSETDAPYIIPNPQRVAGTFKRNEPLYVIEVANAIANIRNHDREIVLSHLVDNARKLFKL